ncbi:MAG: hypothetical protein WA584_06960 [Pyrinomonadaceae bacterium]
MKKARFLLICCLLFGGSMSVEAQKGDTEKPQKQSKSAAKAESEIREFYKERD